MQNIELPVSNYVFKTAFGLASITIGHEEVVSFVLPGVNRVSELRNANNPSNELDSFSKDVIKRVCDYYEGEKVIFDDIPLSMPFGSDFSRSILDNCRKIPYGEVKSYTQLATDSGFPKSVRAVGNILSRNPLPLFIPCHRVIRADGKLGGFMKNIEGAVDIKRRMLELEKSS
ncbi:MAG: methylated-DNA--[protein]-cysteine S-methyltransferase [Sedimentisphaeraceae bacterium JB056]